VAALSASGFVSPFVMKKEERSLCPECGEPILSRRLGHCPSCRAELPEGVRLRDSDSELLDREFDHAKRALRKAQRPDHDDEGGGLCGSGPRNYIGDVDE
jgi:hypothetical protein